MPQSKRDLTITSDQTVQEGRMSESMKKGREH